MGRDDGTRLPVRGSDHFINGLVVRKLISADVKTLGYFGHRAFTKKCPAGRSRTKRVREEEQQSGGQLQGEIESPLLENGPRPEPGGIHPVLRTAGAPIVVDVLRQGT